MRTAVCERATKETDIRAELNLDGKGEAQIETGIGFFDHMLQAFAFHSGIDLTLRAKGDLQVDGHHTIEDVGIVLGQAIARALGDKKGVNRFGSAYIPMDEALGFASIDISGRPYLVFNAGFTGYRIGDMDTQTVQEFFRALAFNAGITLHLRALYGSNDHHVCEALFKALARALRDAVQLNESGKVPSSKGVL